MSIDWVKFFHSLPNLAAILASGYLLVYALWRGYLVRVQGLPGDGAPPRKPNLPGIQITPWLCLVSIAWAVSAIGAQFTRIPSIWLGELAKDLLPFLSLAQILLAVGVITRLSGQFWWGTGLGLLAGQVFFWLGGGLNVEQHFASLWGLAHLTLRVSVLLAAGFILLFHLQRAPRRFRRITQPYIVISFTIGFLITLEFAGWQLLPGTDLSPLLIAASQAGFLFAAERFRLHSVLPLAKESLIDKLNHAVIVLDNAGRIVDLNPAAGHILSTLPEPESRNPIQTVPLNPVEGKEGPPSAKVALPIYSKDSLDWVNRPVSQVIPPLQPYFEKPEQTMPQSLEVDLPSDGEVRHLELMLSSLSGARGERFGWLVLVRDTTQHKLEEARQQALVEHWERQARLLDATLAGSLDLILLNDREGHLLYASPGALQSFGWKVEQVAGKTWRDLKLPTSISQLFEGYLPRLFNSDDPVNFEFSRQTDEETHYYEAFLNLYHPMGDTEVLVVTTLRDVTSRRKMEESLRASEQRYRTMIEVLEEAIVIQDRVGRIIGCNPSAERLLGLSVDEAFGKIFMDTQLLTIHEDGSPFPSESHPAILALRTGQPQSQVVMGVQPVGEPVRWLLANAQPLFQDDEDEPYAVVSSYVEITANKLAEDELRDSQKRFETLLEFAPAAILVVDNRSRIILVNSQAESDFGFPRRKLLGQPVDVLVPERFREKHTLFHNQYMTNPDTRPMGTRMTLSARRADGSEFPVDIGLSPIVTKEGTLVICYAVDISQRQRQEEALRKANLQLTQSLSDLEQHNQELYLLSDMSEILQSCDTIEEAFAVTSDFAARMFPDLSGGLYLYDRERLLVEASTTWGKNAPAAKAFSPNECWALRRGRTHKVERSDSGLQCLHIEKDELKPDQGYLCLPMQAQGEVIGLIHLRGPITAGDSSFESLAVTVTDHITMSISNIALRETLRQQSIHDPLTGLYNRRFMEETLGRELGLASRYQRELGLILFDIDHYKEYNDIHGHAAGDALLQVLGAFLRKNLRSVDFACRYGGEEFLIILPDTPLENSLKVAEKLKGGIGTLQIEHQGSLLDPVTVSMGVVAFQGQPQTTTDLLAEVDRALYEAKQSGRDRIVSRPEISHN